MTLKDEPAARKGVGEKLIKLGSSVSASNELDAKLAESDKAQEATCAEVVLLK